ncbi:MAG: serine protease, partial [Acidobacteriota bacterium]
MVLSTRPKDRLRGYGLVLSIAAALLLVTAPLSAQEVVGEHVYETIGLGSDYPVASERAVKSGEPVLVWADVIVYPGATYIAPHFSWLNLPAGDTLVVRSVDGEQFWTYTGKGRSDLGVSAEGLFATHLKGDTAIFELYSTNTPRSLKAMAGDLPFGVEVDFYGRGYAQHEIDAYWQAGLGADMNLPRPDWLNTKAICGSDDSREAKCYQTSEADAYNESRAVTRLFRNGNVHCTGWLIGSEGHIMTNEHCIGSQSELNTIDFEFGAEGASCSTDCRSGGACSGTIEASGGTLVAVDANLDYALVDPPGANLTATYGYMQLRASGAVVGERLYIPQHPAGWGKRIALESSHPTDGGFATVASVNAPGCGGTGPDVGYYADTQGGSSGSP